MVVALRVAAGVDLGIEVLRQDVVLVDDPAFEVDDALVDVAGGDLLAGHGGQVLLLELVGVATGDGAAIGGDVGHVRRREVDGEAVGLLDEFVRVAGGPHEHEHHRLAPDNAVSGPADRHHVWPAGAVVGHEQRAVAADDLRGKLHRVGIVNLHLVHLAHDN